MSENWTKATYLGLVAHQPLGNGVHRVEDEQLRDAFNSDAFMH
jgi:hypothetical protein